MQSERKARTQKILMLGVDGMDPRLTRKYVAEGKMPNVKKFIERGACREDLVMLGGHPTVTPPMWTTLSTGAYAMTHGITGFKLPSSKGLDYLQYSLHSSSCLAEQLWNCFAEAGKRTLVWHWPGCAWPPTSDNENLWVADGTSPGALGMASGQFEHESMLGADISIAEATFIPQVPADYQAPCTITGLDIPESGTYNINASAGRMESNDIYLTKDKCQIAAPDAPLDIMQSSIRPAEGWLEAPKDAKEFTMLLSGGLIRRPCLVLKNAQGKYDSVAIYKSKKEAEALAVLPLGNMVYKIVDEGIKDDIRIDCVRNMKLVELNEEGTNLRIYISAAMPCDMSKVFHPKSMWDTVLKAAGYVPPTSNVGQQSQELFNIMLESWYENARYQVDALQELMDNHSVECIFSHFHSVDLEEHMFIRYMTDKGYNKLPPEDFCKMMEDLYVQADWYLGQFLKYLDQGWTILIMSDHAQVCSKHDFLMMGDILGVHVNIMEELGLTRVKRDAQGNRLPEIDWEHTIAVAQRECHIYVNQIGRDPYGIVSPEDKYDVEEDIITRLYNYRHPVTGKRVFALAVRNKDAVHFGLGGPRCGDIIYFLAEGYNWDHADSMSSTLGEANTSVSPIFIAVGTGIKSGYKTERVIREVDFAATVAVLGGVRMPAQCEGAPIYQIFSDEF